MIFGSVPFIAMHEFNERNKQYFVQFHFWQCLNAMKQTVFVSVLFMARHGFNETNRQYLFQFHLWLCVNSMKETNDIWFSFICGNA